MTTDDPLEKLAGIFEETHELVQGHVARRIDQAMVARNWLFGWFIEEFERGGASRSEVYAKGQMKSLATHLKTRGIHGCSVQSLNRFRQFYRAYSEIRSTLLSESFSIESTPTTGLTQASLLAPQLEALLSSFSLGWSHYLELMQIDDAEERRFYEIEAAQNQWAVRELRRQIDSSLYERLALSRDKAEIRRLATVGQVIEKASDLVKNPIVLEFLGLEERSHYSEDELESAIIDKLQSFLLELGKGFLFEARQKRFTFDNDHYRVDLVLYNRLLRCYVLLDLKRGKLSHQDLGQMMMYVNYYDREVKLPEELPTVGILLCHDQNEALVELTLPEGSNIFSSRYQLILPSKEDLRRRLVEIKRSLVGEETQKSLGAKSTRPNDSSSSRQ